MNPVGMWYMAESGIYHFHERDSYLRTYRERPSCGHGAEVESVRISANGYCLDKPVPDKILCKHCLKYLSREYARLDPDRKFFKRDIDGSSKI